MKFICIVLLLFLKITINVNAQDTICYEEVYRHKSIKGNFGFDIVADYKKNWLYKLSSTTDSCSITLYKKSDTLSKSFSCKSAAFNMRLGILRNGGCFLTSYLDHRDNTDGKCTITLLDSNLVTTDSFNIKVQNYNPEKYYFLMYLNQKDDTVIIKNAIYGGAVYFFFTKKKLLMKRYSYSPDYYDFSRDSVAHSKNYYSFSDINDGIKYDSDYKIERFENINEISKKDDVYIINEYTFFIENGLVTQLKNGDIVFYKFCESVEDE